MLLVATCITLVWTQRPEFARKLVIDGLEVTKEAIQKLRKKQSLVFQEDHWHPKEYVRVPSAVRLESQTLFFLVLSSYYADHNITFYEFIMVVHFVALLSLVHFPCRILVTVI